MLIIEPSGTLGIQFLLLLFSFLFSLIFQFVIGGANDNFPRRKLFTRLKHGFLSHTASAVSTVPVSALVGEGRGLLRDRLLEVPDLFRGLYPPARVSCSAYQDIEKLK